MAWTDPAGHVWATSETVTAANMNTFIRLNLEETAPDKAVAAGDVFYATAANTIARLSGGASIDHQVLRAGATPAWTSIDEFLQIRNSGTSGNTLLTASYQTIVSVVVNPGWGEFTIRAMGDAGIKGAGTGNRFSVSIFDGTNRSTADCGTGSATTFCSAGIVFGIGGFTASTTVSLQVKQDDAGTAGTLDHGQLMTFAVRTS